MRRVTLAIVFAAACAVFPQPALAAEALTFDHMHLAFPDAAASTAWYIKYLGATARPDGMNGVFFGPYRFNMAKLDNPMPSDGSVIDAVGLSYANLDDRMKALDGSGVKILQAPKMVPGFFRTAIVQDPWGTKIELVQDPQLLGFHHVRLRSTDPAAMRQWFQAKLGGEPGKIGGGDALKFGGVWMIVDKAATAPAPSKGTAIDHLGFRTKDIKTEVADLTANGVEVTGAPRQDPAVATTFATFLNGATGRIELTQR